MFGYLSSIFVTLTKNMLKRCFSHKNSVFSVRTVKTITFNINLKSWDSRDALLKKNRVAHGIVDNNLKMYKFTEE